MNRISGPLAVLAGLFLMLPGIFAMLHGSSAENAMPGWLMRDLIICTLMGGAVMFWGASLVRQRELELHAIPARIRNRRRA